MSSRAKAAMCMKRSAVTWFTCGCYAFDGAIIKDFPLTLIFLFMQVLLKPMMHEEPSDL